MASGRILLLRGGAIGDFILTLPALAALRHHFPTAQVEVMGYPHIACLAALAGLAHAVHPIEARPLAAFFARNATLDPAATGFFAGFDVIVSYLYDPDRIFRENVGRCSRAQFLQAAHRPDERALTHATEVFLEPLRALAIFDADPTPRIPLPTDAPPNEPPCIAVHPGSGSERKNWPEDRWLELLTRLTHEHDLPVLLVGGEAEGERLHRLASALPHDRRRLARRLPLDQLAPLLSRCRLFLGHDSGITHLAAALGVPCVVLWGPTNPAIWRPRGSHDVRLLQHEHGLLALDPRSVLAACQDLLTAPRA